MQHKALEHGEQTYETLDYLHSLPEFLEAGLQAGIHAMRNLDGKTTLMVSTPSMPSTHQVESTSPPHPLQAHVPLGEG